MAISQIFLKGMEIYEWSTFILTHTGIDIVIFLVCFKIVWKNKTCRSHFDPKTVGRLSYKDVHGLVGVVPRIYVEKARAYHLIYLNLLGTAKL